MDEFIRIVNDDNQSNRYELIDGYIYMMPIPSVIHQRISGFVYRNLSNYLIDKLCEAFIAPLDVYLYDRKNNCNNAYQPDVFVVCDKNKIKDRGVYGSPDFVIEVVSPSSKNFDYVYKFYKYMQFGVKEYWIINPLTNQIIVYFVSEDGDIDSYSHTFNDVIRVSLFNDLFIDFKELER